MHGFPCLYGYISGEASKAVSTYSWLFVRGPVRQNFLGSGSQESPHRLEGAFFETLRRSKPLTILHPRHRNIFRNFELFPEEAFRPTKECNTCTRYKNMRQEKANEEQRGKQRGSDPRLLASPVSLIGCDLRRGTCKNVFGSTDGSGESESYDLPGSCGNGRAIRWMDILIDQSGERSAQSRPILRPRTVETGGKCSHRRRAGGEGRLVKSRTSRARPCKNVTYSRWEWIYNGCKKFLTRTRHAISVSLNEEHREVQLCPFGV